MGATNHLLREILQEIREVKAHVIPQRPSVISSSVDTRSPVLDPAYSVAEPATKGAFKGKPRWQHTNTESYVYEFPAVSAVAHPSAVARPSAVASAGGGSALSLQEFRSLMSKPSNEEKKEILYSLLGHVKNPKKVVASDLVYNSELECFIDQEGNCYGSDLNENTLESKPDMSKIIGRIRPGVDRESAQPSNFIASNARSRKHKNRHNRTRKN